MPVVVTGADRPLGRAVVEALRATGAVEVRATVRDRSAAAALVARGVKAAVSDLVDPLRLGGVLEGAHTVIHLDQADDNTGPVQSWELLLDAAEDTGVRRLVTVCGPEVPPPSAEGYEVVVVRAEFPAEPAPPLVAALVEADRRREVTRLEVVEIAW